MNRSFLWIAAVSGAVTMAVPASAQLSLRNGSFEAIGAQYSPALGGIHAATDWVNTSGLNIQASSVLAGSEGTPVAAASGSRYLRLVSDNPDPQNTGFLYQDLGTITAGRRYTITGDAFGGDSVNNLFGALFTVSSTADGGQVYATSGVTGLARGAATSFSFTFDGTQAASGQSAFLRLAAVTSGPGQATRGGLDNLQLAVSAVPEPASWALMIGGFGLVGTGLRRRTVRASLATG